MKKIATISTILVTALLGPGAITVPAGSISNKAEVRLPQTGKLVAPPAAGHRELAQQANAAGHSEVALRHLQMAHAAEPTNLDIVDAFLRTVSLQIALKLERDEHRDAKNLVEWARGVVTNTEDNMIQGDPHSFLPLHKREQTVDQVDRLLQKDVIEKASGRIQIARDHGENAQRWYWFNNRQDVLSGLKDLRWVYDRFDLLDADTRGNYHLALSELKKRVSDKEWADLIASAGFHSRQPASS